MKKNTSWQFPLCADAATRHSHLPDLKLYLITDSRLFSTPCAFYFGVEDALSGGAKSVQLREKDISAGELLETAYWMRDLTREYNALLFINDRVDIALAAEADGVHLGQNSLPPQAARKIGGKNLIGASCHNLGEAVAAEQSGADFLTIGPVYETPSKMKYGDPVGIWRTRACEKQRVHPRACGRGDKAPDGKGGPPCRGRRDRAHLGGLRCRKYHGNDWRIYEDAVMTRIELARQGVITDEMKQVAMDEKIPPEQLAIRYRRRVYSHPDKSGPPD